MIFETVAQLKLATLTAGQLVSTKGYYASGDGGAADYIVAATQAVDGYGDHALAGGTVALLETGALVDVKQYGAKGDGVTDDTVALQAAFDSGHYLTLVGDFLVSSVVIPQGTTIDAQGSIICSQEITTVTINSDVTIFGKITFDGAGIGGSVGGNRIEVPGDNVSLPHVVVKDISSDLKGSQGPVQAAAYGINVEGDYFSADFVESNRGGYAPLRLIIRKNLNSFSVQKVRAIDYWFKGFVVNGSGFLCKSIFFDDYYAEYNYSDDATSGLLIDTAATNTIIDVDTLHINKYESYGGEANGLKIENVENCTMLSVKTRMDGAINNPHYGMTMNSRKFFCNSLDIDRAVTAQCQEFNVDKFRTTFADGRLIEFKDTYHVGPYIHRLGDVIAPEAASTIGLLRFTHDNAQPLNVSINSIYSPVNVFSIGNTLPSNSGDGQIIVCGEIQGYSGLLTTGSPAKDLLIRVGDALNRCTSVQVADITHPINTKNKTLSKGVYLTDTFEVVYASNYNTTSAWRSADGVIVYAPS